MIVAEFCDCINMHCFLKQLYSSSKQVQLQLIEHWMVLGPLAAWT